MTGGTHFAKRPIPGSAGKFGFAAPPAAIMVIG
jgi:hypothetical protein